MREGTVSHDVPHEEGVVCDELLTVTIYSFIKQFYKSSILLKVWK